MTKSKALICLRSRGKSDCMQGQMGGVLKANMKMFPLSQNSTLSSPGGGLTSQTAPYVTSLFLKQLNAVIIADF